MSKKGKQSFNLLEWDCQPESLPSNPTIVAYGKRRTGKSTSILNIMCNCLDDIPFGLVMSNTAFGGAWDEIIPPQFIIQGWQQHILEQLVSRQQRLITLYGKDDPRTRAFLILDDVISDRRNVAGWNTMMNRFFTEGRHFNITIFITTQYVKGIGPMLRNNADLVILQPIYSVNDRTTLWEMYGGFMDKKSFFELMNQYAMSTPLEGHTPANPNKEVSVIVVKAYEDFPTLEDTFAWWKPLRVDKLPKFRLCDDAYWQQASFVPKQAIVKKPDVSRVLNDVVNTLDSVAE